MHFRSRLILSFSLLVSGLIALLAVVFEFFNLKHLETLSKQNLDIVCKNMSHQLDEIVRPMVFITDFLLSDSRTLSGITVVSRAERGRANKALIAEAKKDIRYSFSTYCNDVNFHRVTFFSEEGDILSSNMMVHTTPDGEAMPGKISAIPRVDAAMGKPVLIPVYHDPWNTVNPAKVFGIMRLIMGNNISSYMEVQKSAAALENIYNIDNTGSYQIAVINGRGDIFYSQLEENENRLLLSMAESYSGEKSITAFDDRYAVSFYSPYTDTYTVVIQTKIAMTHAIRDTTFVTIVMALCLCAASMALIRVLSIRITAPIGSLIRRIENTSLDNIESESALDISSALEAGASGALSPPDYRDDELVLLWKSYNQLLKRLNTARRQEEQMSMLHMQAEFDALQAQMNPHFLYNVLNVISHRGVQNRDETICEICERLASMLRYSAGTSRRLVPIREELEYLNHYLFLLKTRYRDKLVYSFDIAPEIMDQMIPKIVLQQLVENSISHGFAETSDVMRISVKGRREDGLWLVEIRDNGRGFTEEEKSGIERKMEKIAGALNEGKFALDIGGMGLLNIYARFLILYGGRAVFKIGNAESGGAKLIIGAAIDKRIFS